MAGREFAEDLSLGIALFAISLLTGRTTTQTTSLTVKVQDVAGLRSPNPDPTLTGKKIPGPPQTTTKAGHISKHLQLHPPQTDPPPRSNPHTLAAKHRETDASLDSSPNPTTSKGYPTPSPRHRGPHTPFSSPTHPLGAPAQRKPPHHHQPGAVPSQRATKVQPHTPHPHPSAPALPRAVSPAIHHGDLRRPRPRTRKRRHTESGATSLKPRTHGKQPSTHPKSSEKVRG